MTPEQQRICIAEACGFEPEYAWMKWERNSSNLAGKGVWMAAGLSYYFASLPDYLNDLNAMHEVEKVLKGAYDDENSEKSEYSEQLVMVCAGTQELADIWYWHQIHATAAQRAEAFLKTIGQWKETT